MNKIQHLALGLLSLGLLAACTGEQSSTNDRDSVALLSDTTLMEDRVPFRLAERYFAAADSLPATLLSAEEQEQYMGMAASSSSPSSCLPRASPPRSSPSRYSSVRQGSSS